MALIGISGNAQVAPPPNRPTMTSLPPLVRQSNPSCVVAALPTRSITALIGPPALLASCSSASGAAPSTVASAPAFSAASRLRASISTTIAPLPPIAFSSDNALRPGPPAPKSTIGLSKLDSTFFSALNVVTPEQAYGAAVTGSRPLRFNRYLGCG